VRGTDLYRIKCHCLVLVMGGKTLEQLAQRGGGVPIPGSIQGRVGPGSEQPDLAEDVPAHCRGVGLDDL